MFQAPGVVIWLLGIFVAVFGAMAFLPPQVLLAVLDGFAFIPARFTGVEWTQLSTDPNQIFAITPVLTYAFLHGDLLHLLLNCLWFLAFGTPVARRLGGFAFLIFCAVTAILAALAYWVLHLSSEIPMVGASGTISGLMGGAVRFMFLDPRGTWGREGGLMPLTSQPVIAFSIMWVVINVVMGVGGVGTSSPEQSIAWEAHLGGYFAGLLLFSWFDWRRPSRTPGMVVFEEVR